MKTKNNFQFGEHVVAFNTFKYFQIINIIRMNVFIFNIMLLIFYGWRPLEPNTKLRIEFIRIKVRNYLQTVCARNLSSQFQNLEINFQSTFLLISIASLYWYQSCLNCMFFKLEKSDEFPKIQGVQGHTSKLVLRNSSRAHIHLDRWKVWWWKVRNEVGQ